MPFDGQNLHRSWTKEAELRDAIAVLERAREIVRTRWTRAWITSVPGPPPPLVWRLLRRRRENQRHYCAAGALVIAVHGEKFPGRLSPIEMSNAFCMLTIDRHPAVEALGKIADASARGGVIAWNDTRLDANAVVAGFDKAIANLQAEIVKGVTHAV